MVRHSDVGFAALLGLVLAASARAQTGENLQIPVPGTGHTGGPLVAAYLAQRRAGP